MSILSLLCHGTHVLDPLVRQVGNSSSSSSSSAQAQPTEQVDADIQAAIKASLEQIEIDNQARAERSFQNFAEKADIEAHALIAESMIDVDNRDGSSVDGIIEYIRLLPERVRLQVWAHVLQAHKGLLVNQMITKYGNDISKAPADVQAVFQDPSVKKRPIKLDLNVHSNLTAANVDRFTKTFTNITELNVGGRDTGLDTAAVEAIVRNLPGIKSLTLTDANGVGEAAANALCTLNKDTVEHINLTRCHIGAARARLTAHFGAEKLRF